MSAKILIVEDESLVALEIKSALKKEGYSIVGTVTSSNEVFKVIENEIPDLIMMDINIDGPINGIETSRRIKIIYNIPIIFLTAYSDKSTIDEAISTSPKSYLIKPFKRQELYASVALALADNEKSSQNIISISKKCIYYPELSKLDIKSEIILLSKKEKQLLDLLLTYINKLVPIETIEYELWPDKSISATTRRTLIHRLREKVGKECIKTIKDQGCILEIGSDKLPNR